jgi:hypothetical protein
MFMLGVDAEHTFETTIGECVVEIKTTRCDAAAQFCGVEQPAIHVYLTFDFLDQEDEDGENVFIALASFMTPAEARRIGYTLLDAADQRDPVVPGSNDINPASN